MSETLALLRRQFGAGSLSLTEVREQYFSHIKTDRHLLREIKKGRVRLAIQQLHTSPRTVPRVRLEDLAALLDTPSKYPCEESTLI